jgi:hypothetical protein
MRNRYDPATLTPVRRDAKEAVSLDKDGAEDGLWLYAWERAQRGTPWHLRHEPSGFVSREWFTSLDEARHWTGTGRIWPRMWADASELAQTREFVDPWLPVGEHDRARALLTWMAERGLHPDDTSHPVDPE